MLFIRRARAGESTAEGEYVASYVDAMMDDKKEDGFATLSAIYLALKAYKEENPHITHAAVKTDGAGTPPPCTARGGSCTACDADPTAPSCFRPGAYSGIVCTAGLPLMGELTGIRVDDAFTGESGKGKSQLDGHFGVKGSKLRRLIAAALHDVLTPQALYEGVAKLLSANEKAMLFQADRSAGSTLDVESVKQLSAMSHRHYVYAEDGTFEAIVLRQQSWLGVGLRVEASKLRKPDARAFQPPKVLGTAGSTSSAGARSATASSEAKAAAKSGKSAAEPRCEPCSSDQLKRRCRRHASDREKQGRARARRGAACPEGRERGGATASGGGCQKVDCPGAVRTEPRILVQLRHGGRPRLQLRERARMQPCLAHQERPAPGGRDQAVPCRRGGWPRDGAGEGRQSRPDRADLGGGGQ